MDKKESGQRAIATEGMISDIKKLFGKPPYNTCTNFCWNDNYFGASLVTKYGMSLDELSKLTGVKK